MTALSGGSSPTGLGTAFGRYFPISVLVPNVLWYQLFSRLGSLGTLLDQKFFENHQSLCLLIRLLLYLSPTSFLLIKKGITWIQNRKVIFLPTSSPLWSRLPSQARTPFLVLCVTFQKEYGFPVMLGPVFLPLGFFGENTFPFLLLAMILLTLSPLGGAIGCFQS